MLKIKICDDSDPDLNASASEKIDTGFALFN